MNTTSMQSAKTKVKDEVIALAVFIAILVISYLMAELMTFGQLFVMLSQDPSFTQFAVKVGLEGRFLLILAIFLNVANVFISATWKPALLVLVTVVLVGMVNIGRELRALKKLRK